MAALNRAIDMPPPAAEGLSARGIALARRLFVAPKPETAAQVIARADQARDRRDWAEAAREYAAGIGAGAADAGLHVQLGHALKELGDYAAAEAAYSRFLSLDPDDADVHLQMGHLCNRQGDLERALDWYERASRLAPNDADIAGHARQTRHRFARSDVDAKRAKALAHVEARAWHRARFLLNELVTIDGEESLIGIFANVTKETGDFAEAERLYERYAAYAASQAPDLVADVALQRGHLARATGDEARALRHYIAARKAHVEHCGESDADSPYDRAVQASIDEIYTCFWRQG